MLPPSSQKKSSQKRDFDLGLHASHHLKNNPPKGRVHKRWDKNLVQEILLLEGYLHVSTFYSAFPFFQRGCCPSFTQTRCQCSLVWNILSSWNIGICSLSTKTVGNGSISFPSYSQKNLM